MDASANVDEELMVSAELEAAELRRERASLKETNVMLAQRLSRAQDALARLKREDQAREAELVDANARLFEELQRKTAAVEATETSRQTMASSIATLEGILSDAEREKSQRDEAHRTLLEKYLALQQRQLSVEREIAVRGPTEAVGRAAPERHDVRYDVDEVCARDAALVSATSALRSVERLQHNVAALLSAVQEQQSGPHAAVSAAFARVQRQCEKVVAVDAEVIRALEAALVEKHRELLQARQKHQEVEAILVDAEKALSAAKRELHEKEAAMAHQRERLLAAETAAMGRAGSAALEQKLAAAKATVQAERAARAQESEAAARRLQQSRELEQRLRQYVGHLEAALQERGSIAAALERGEVDEARREAELRAVDAAVGTFDSAVQTAVTRMRHAIAKVQRRSNSSCAGAGLSSSPSPSQSRSSEEASLSSSSDSPAPQSPPQVV